MADLIAQLRQADRDRYLASLLMPESVRNDLAALYLFNADLAAIRERIKEPMAGEIRLQWWREVLSGERAGEASGHPFAAALLDVIRRHRLPKEALERMLEAREFDLYDDPMPERADYEAYAGQTASCLIQLSALILDPDTAGAFADASGHAGVAQSVAGHLMLLPVHRVRGQLYLPGELLSAVGLDREAFLAGADSLRIDAAISAFAAFGREHLDKARQALGTTPESAARRAFVPVAFAGDVFKRAERAGAACLERPAQPSLLLRQWRIWRATSNGTI